MEIKYITHINIDKQKWDACILNATNHLIYAEAWYLDIVCKKKWNALILNDYEAVMPLPLKSKMGLTYVQQPVWTQQLGVFSTLKLTEEMTQLFLDAIPKKMAMISLNLNTNNCLENVVMTTKTNIVLNLNNNLETLQSNFSPNTKRNIKKAHQSELTIDLAYQNTDEFIHFFKNNAQPPLPEKHFQLFCKLVALTLEKNKGIIAVVKHQDELVAASFILKSPHRLIYRTGTSSAKGKTLKAMFFLVNEIIRNHANSNTVLDFEGSNIAGVARFYKGFGGVNQPYYYYKKNPFKRR